MKNTDNNKSRSLKSMRGLIALITIIVAAALAVTCVLCFDSPSKKVDGGDVGQGSVVTSATNRGAITGTTAVTNIKSGSYVVGDYFEYGYTGGVVSVQLVPGTYKLEAYGAAGGGLAAAGGRGGYATGIYTITSTSYLYICVGNVGTNSTTSIDGNHDTTHYAGGYNGGGAGSGSAGPGGGGATHIATANFTASSYSSNLNNLLVVGGGGGGGGTTTYTEVYGTGSNGNYTTYGVGETGCSTRHSSSYSNDEGGGGGGYHGGGVRHGDDTKASYAGENYVKSGLASSSNSYGQREGTGLARITIQSITNNAPTTKSYAGLSGQSLGSVSHSIAASTLAQDPDATVNSNGSATTVYYNNTGSALYLDSGLTVNANTYMTYSMTSTTLSITAFNKLPRQGSNASNNSMTVYCKIRDNCPHGYATTVISFTISFSALTINRGSNVSGAACGGTAGYTYSLGLSNTTNANDLMSGKIYYPTANTWALSIHQPIKLNETATINASGLLSNYNSTYYAAYIVPSAIPSGAPYSYTGTTTTIGDWTSGESYTNKSGYATLGIKGTGASGSVQTITATLFIVEKSSVGAVNREPASVTYSSCATLYITFRVGNNRPILGTTGTNVDVAVGETKNLSLATYFTDQDAAITTSTHSIIGVKVPDKEFVQVNQYGTISTTAGRGGAAASTSYYNVYNSSTADAVSTAASDVNTGFNANIATNSSTTSSAFLKYSYSGITLSVTGLRASFSQYSSSRTSNKAATGGTAAAPTASGSIANPGHFYLMIQIKDNNDVSDTGIWLPIAFTITPNLAPVGTGTATNGQAASTEMPSASGSVGDKFYFAPMGIRIGNSLVTVGNGVPSGYTLQPLALDGDNFTATNGLSSWGSKYNEFLNITSTADQIAASIKTSGDGAYVSARLIDLTVPKSTIDGSRVAAVGGVSNLGLTASGDNYVFKGLELTLLAPTRNRYCSVQVAVKDASNLSVTVEIPVRVKNNGLTVLDEGAEVPTLTRTNLNAESSYSSTGGPTFTYKVPVGYTFMITPYDAVRDIDFTKEGSDPKANFGLTEGFTLNGFSGKLAGTVFTVGGTAGSGETAINALFAGSTYSAYSSTDYQNKIINILTNHSKSTAMRKIATASTFSANSSAGAGTLYNERLFFARTGETANADPFGYNPTNSTFAITQSNVGSYLTVTNGTQVNIGGTAYNLDFICVKANRRTQQTATLTLTVRDRCGNTTDCNATQTITINIEVVNTAPVVSNPTAVSIAVDPVTVDGKVVPTEASVNVSNVMYDADEDQLSYLMNRGVLVADGRLIALYNTTRYTDDEIRSFDDPKITADYKEYNGVVLGTQYLTAELHDTETLYVTALNSTKAIADGVYVYFFVSDGRGGETLGYKQIEVENTSPVFNADTDNGFVKNVTDTVEDERDKYVWKIESSSASDYSRPRYIVGSLNAAEKLMTGSLNNQALGAVAADIKLIASDRDNLSGVLLSPRGTASGYVNDFKVPDFAFDTGLPAADASNTDPTAIIIFSERLSGSTVTASKAVPENSGLTPTLLFYVNNQWYTRDSLVAALSDQDVKDACFDAQGRWILRDFALRLTSTNAFASTDKLGVTFSIRDEAQFGGDTAGLATAYNSERPATQAVSTTISPTVYLKITGTGIISKAEFDKYDGYYVVEDPASNGEFNGKVYLSTYDGDVNSVYGENAYANGLYYSKDANGVYTVASTGTPDTAIKADRGATDADNTKAGVNSGKMFVANNFDVDAAADEEGAYRYPDTITIPATKADGENYDGVYVPMSYFGILSDMASPDSASGAVSYSTTYVGFDNRGVNGANIACDRGNLASFYNALSLTDGAQTWTGAALNSNPYITFDAFIDTNASHFNDAYSRPYYNMALAVPTVNAKGELNRFVEYSGNYNSYVGNGRLMYLETQARDVKEHNFGIVIKKNKMRTGTVKLTLTVKLVKSLNGETDYENSGDDLVVSTNIEVLNSALDLVLDTNASNPYRLKYDGEANAEGDGTYYVDVELPSASSEMFSLVRDNSDAIETSTTAVANAKHIYYTDADYVGGSTRRDYAYFSRDSLVRLSDQKVDYERPYAVSGGKLQNTIRAERGYAGANNYKAINSVLNYYGASSVDDLGDIDSSYVPNDGKYGSTSEGYSDYFNVSMTENGRILNLMTTRKTFINPSAIEGIVEDSSDPAHAYATAAGVAPLAWDSSATNGYGGLTRAQVSAIYASRGLVPVFADETSPEVSKAYYPLKVLIYDSYGAGWDSAAYVALEFRVSIKNATPTLKAGASDSIKKNDDGTYEYGMSLAVGRSASVNLYSLVNDPDIYRVNEGSAYRLATEEQFINLDPKKDGITRETGDFLLSPYANDVHLTATGSNPTRPNNQAALENGTAGLSPERSTGNDVIMWMEAPRDSDGQIAAITATTLPSSNILWFTVNRRTTKSDGTPLSDFVFKMRFYDSQGAFTDELLFKIHVENQAPTINQSVQNNYSHVTMRIGDSFTILTSYYNVFNGGGEGSVAYLNSQTYKNWNTSRLGNPSALWSMSEITGGINGNEPYGKLADFAEHMNTVSTPHDTNFDIGFLGLSNDDTPWKLRFTSYPGLQNGSIPGITQLNTVAYNLLPLENEGSSEMDFASHPYYPTAITITAVGASSRTIEFPIVIQDGEGGIASHVIEIDIISSPPTPRDPDNADDATRLAAVGLQGALDTDSAGVFRMFAIPNAPSANHSMQVTIDGMGQQTAYDRFTIRPSDVAYDNDSENETNMMMFYESGLPAVNDVALETDTDGWFNSDYFRLRVQNNSREMVIEITGYNPTNDYEQLTFYVGDYGNNVLENARMITIRVYTVYSDMINESVAALSDANYAAYLSGSEKVHVKSVDSYEGIGEFADTDPAKLGIGSQYAFVEFDGLTGTDGNTKSPINDPDVSTHGDSTYDVTIFALMDAEKFEPLPASTLQSLFTRNKATETFSLKTDLDTDTLDRYRIGTTVGTQIQATTLLEKVEKYVEFTFGVYGTTVTFKPKNATLDQKLLLYIEVQKQLGARNAKRSNGVLVSGTVFTLEVADSAPQTVHDAQSDDFDREVEGKKGDTFTFDIYDHENPLGALFMDSDADDVITVNFDSDSDAAYEAALEAALEADPALDWKSDATAGKVRAITVAVDNNTHELKITINRRMDKKIADGYAEKVSFPMTFTGYDHDRKPATVTINITVGNNIATATTERIERFDPDTNVGYSFEQSNVNEYTLDVQILSRADYTIELSDFMLDEDYTTGKDTDSYRFVRGTNEEYSYLLDEPLTAYHMINEVSGESVELATLSPVGDATHRTGIKFHALDSYRSYTGVAYACIMDRSTSADYRGNSVSLVIHITVMNDRPYTLTDKDTTKETLLGSNAGVTEEREFFIGDYVADNNKSDVVGPDSGLAENRETYLRIYSTSYDAATELYSTTSTGVDDKGEAITGYDSSRLFTLYIVDSADSYGQKFIIRPEPGFYGVGSILITVADGDMSTRSDTLTVSFRINVEVVYNPADIEDLNGITTNVGKTTIVTIDTIIPDIENSLAGNERVLSTFNPSSAYELLSITADESANEFVSINHSENSAVWSLRALKITGSPKRLTATYALKSTEQSYSKQFLFTVNDNLRPSIIHREIEFTRFVDGEEVDPLTSLNSDDTIYLSAEMLLSDPENDLLKIISVRSQKPSLVSVSLVDNNTQIAIKFNGRGEAIITIEVADETGEVCVRSFTAVNKDLPEPGLWVQFMANLESNTLMWSLIIAGVLLVIIVLIIIIAVSRKRKRDREELEALLVSEMEIEEQMLKLAGGPASTDYQSYGYLPPVPQQAPVDPGMMLGAGAAAPDTQNLALPSGGESGANSGDVPPPDATTPYDGQ